jgi:hypothetical protein
MKTDVKSQPVSRSKPKAKSKHSKNTDDKMNDDSGREAWLSEFRNLQIDQDCAWIDDAVSNSSLLAMPGSGEPEPLELPDPDHSFSALDDEFDLGESTQKTLKEFGGSDGTWIVDDVSSIVLCSHCCSFR